MLCFFPLGGMALVFSKSPNHQLIFHLPAVKDPLFCGDWVFENAKRFSNILIAREQLYVVTRLHCWVEDYLLYHHLSLSLWQKETMPIALLRIVLGLLFLVSIGTKSAGEFEQWCIADEQTPDDELQAGIDWACGEGGADCSKIQVNKPCYFPNTVRDHASYAFNNYYQKFKSKGGTCYFNGAAMITELDPSHNFCHYDFIP